MFDSNVYALTPHNVDKPRYCHMALFVVFSIVQSVCYEHRVSNMMTTTNQFVHYNYVNPFQAPPAVIPLIGKYRATKFTLHFRTAHADVWLNC